MNTIGVKYMLHDMWKTSCVFSLLILEKMDKHETFKSRRKIFSYTMYSELVKVLSLYYRIKGKRVFVEATLHSEIVLSEKCKCLYIYSC